MSSDYFPGADNPLISPFPLIFIRKDKNFKPTSEVEVNYFFTENDSLIRLVSYKWSPKVSGINYKGLKSHSNKLLEYTDKYNLIFTQLTNELGNPNYYDSKLKNAEKKDFKQWLEKSAKWNKDDTIVELKMIFM